MTAYDEPPATQCQEPGLAIELAGFSFAYPDAAHPAIAGLTWTLERGAFCLLTGNTGSGKTTLLRCLKPEIAPEGHRTGTVCVCGMPYSELARHNSAELVGYVAQNPANQIVCDTVWHELAFGLENLGCEQDVMRRRVAEVTAFFGIESWINRATDSLSGGQQQLLNLAAVLAMRPQLLLLDEPTAQLDPVAEKGFLHMLFRVNRELGLTVVVATHSPEPMRDYATDHLELPGAGSLDLGAQSWVEAPSANFQPKVVAEVRDAYFRYGRTDPWVLRGCGLSVGKGEIRALVGGNGSGKTTLLNVIAGTVKPQRGRVRNAEQDEQVLLPQDPRLLFVCDTVSEELREWQRACDYADSDITAAEKRFMLTGLGAQHPYDLSGGQQQLLALAKLVLCRPRLLLLDEPTKGLDAPTRLAIGHLLRELKGRGCTIVIATHDLSFASRVADSVSMLFDGDVTCTDRSRDFFEDNLFYQPTRDGFAKLWDADSKGEGGA